MLFHSFHKILAVQLLRIKPDWGTPNSWCTARISLYGHSITHKLCEKHRNRNQLSKKALLCLNHKITFLFFP